MSAVAAPKATSFESRSLIVLSAIYLMLSARLDGWGHAIQTVSKQLELLPFTALFLLLVGIGCFWMPGTAFQRPVQQWLDRFAGRPLQRVGLGLAALLQGASILVVIVEAFYFRRLGYVLNLPAMVAIALLSAVAFVGAWFAPLRRQAEALLVASGVGYFLLAAYSIHFFPLTPMKSDNLPLIVAACGRFAAGHFPYVFYPLPSGAVVLTYLPLTWMSYLPAALLHVDIRWTNVVLTLAAVAIVYASVPGRLRLLAACLLGGFLVLPYSAYHHDIYISMQWLCFAAMFALLQRGRTLAAAVVLGFGIAASQLFWVATPFFLLVLFFREGWRRAGAALAILLAAAAVWVAPFYIASPHEFVFAIFTHWGIGGDIIARSYNLIFWVWLVLSHFGQATIQNYQRVQAVTLGVLFLCAVRARIRTEAAAWRWSAAGITLFGLTNFIAWPYFHLTGCFALVLGVLCVAQGEG